MYRKSMEVEREANGSEFMTRLYELPVSKLAVMQLSSLYERAREQRILALGLKAGEGTLNLAAKVATPLMNVLPVSSLDHMACKQLELIEQVVPAIRKDPKPLLDSTEDIVNKALAPAYNTVSTVKDLGYQTISGVKNYAAETTAPTVERVNKVTSYGKETYDNVKTGVGATYEGTKDTVANLCTSEGMKNTFNTTYNSVREFDYAKVRHACVENVEHSKQKLYDGVEGARSEVGNYAIATLQPTVRRYKAARQYSTDKVNGTVAGVKNMGQSVANSVTGTINGALNYAEQTLEYYLPLDTDSECDNDFEETSQMQVMNDNDVAGKQVHPASAEAGSWNRTMRLMTSLNQRIYGAGSRQYKYYNTLANDTIDGIQMKYKSQKASIESAYKRSSDYVSSSYDSVRNGVNNTTNTIQEYSTGAYNAGKRTWNTTKDSAVWMYDSATQTWTATYDFTTNSIAGAQDKWNHRDEFKNAMYEAAQRRYEMTQEWLRSAANNPSEYSSRTYTRAKNGFWSAQNYTKETYNYLVTGAQKSMDGSKEWYNWAKNKSSDMRVVMLDSWSVTQSRIVGAYGYTTEWATVVIDGTKGTFLYQYMFPTAAKDTKEQLNGNERVPDLIESTDDSNEKVALKDTVMDGVNGANAIPQTPDLKNEKETDVDDEGEE